MNIPFTKMHGIGNDYVYVNGFETVIADPENVAKKIADRHFGVGGDGLIMILPPDKGVEAHVRMRMFNADGSESEMCGNGIRCVCKFAHDHGLSKANPMRIQTGRGVLTLKHTTNGDGKVDRVTVDMGEPMWTAEDVGVREDDLPELLDDLKKAESRGMWSDAKSRSNGERLLEEFAPLDRRFKWISMGNPHIVFFVVGNPKAIRLETVGPMVELHKAFSRRVNAHFVQMHSRNEVTMRTWERGSGITLACGTGASAVCCAGAALGLTDREILAHLPGGDLQLRWDEKSNHVFMTGPATEVFSGVWKSDQ